MLWLFLPFVVILSGVVAYAADTIARKAGRKHLRWFGMRPKTTALVVAVLSGMGISAASLAAFLILNSSAVNTIAQADQLRPQLEALRGDIRAAQADRDRAQQEAARLRAQQAAAQSALKAAQTALTGARAAQARVQEQARTLETRVQELTAAQRALETRAAQTRAKLQTAEASLTASQARAQNLDAQVVDLGVRIALSERETRSAQDRARAAQSAAEAAQARAQAQQDLAQQAQTRARQAQAQAQQARDQIDSLAASRAQADQALRAAQQNLQQAQQALEAAQAQQRDAQQARDQLRAERDRLNTERGSLIKARDQAARDRDRVREDLNALQAQQQQLRDSNEALRATLGRLQDEYSSSRAELSATRNTDLAYPKNDLVYAAVVPGVRNLDQFLSDAARSAAARGAKGSPAARLNPVARGALETKLRGLNASSFVQCRAAQNAAVGFAVDLTCDARPNVMLYRADQVIRRGTVTLGDLRRVQDQIGELVQDATLDLTSRGVPSEYVQGLDVGELVPLITRLNGRTGVAVVGIAARADVRPGSRVDLYPVLP
ncbi:hypothetical protein GCM10008956_19080 [Deinococcus arenae]|uniref:DUF3084 domain-containing protein n=1 Tax=Deinococcus arenae TaxID=1452751 RepID=A0A8H9GPC0_9DEIO|nr:DUF3084 domain-containing protein [Deinococcus arenae]AWT36536.1 DUF3084 domain-containing protein [Deinococcus actinosclerus]GGM42881.1 hypothetical protein GCM10008956_19080 [Deinococcus arenae]